jgi:hypothetical protein
MKKLFCTVVTDYDGTLAGPMIFHTRAEKPADVEPHIREELCELGFEDSVLDDIFEVFTFEVSDLDIIEV